MRILSFVIVILLLFAVQINSQSKHGEALQFDCSYCHESTTWQVKKSEMKFNHSKDTKFKITGQHLNVDCKTCHSTLIFTDASPDCFSCHKDIHQNTVGFECSKCHSPESWIVKDIDGLHQLSRFPLLGAHKTADCSQCHTGFENLTFGPIEASCYTCHQQDYAGTTMPNHIQAGFSTECQECHSISELNWTAQNFNHDFFPLTGGHNISNCFSCHQQGSYTGVSTECYSCHRDDYERVTDPNHVAGNFSTDCRQCHTINGWSPSTFDHNLTQFPLTGAHINTNCTSCHSSGYANTPTECVACHQDNYNAAANPSHTAAGIPTDCKSCHETAAWIPSTFNHITTGFELTGAHTPLECSSCHNGSVTGQNSECISCHQDNYNTAPEHVAQSYPQNCTMCHNTVAWNQTNFDHQATNFPLTGAHTSVECSNCHQGGFSGTPTDCAACHQSNYNAAVNPSHTALALPTDCASCHSTNPNWEPALFPNHNNYYELIGAHAQIASNCITCHNGNYTTTPNTCFGCHETDYNGTTNPQHAAAGFGTECQTCHSQTAWTPATFDHDNQYFPIYSGKHAGVWTLCSECHTTPSNFSVFSCIDCHEHNRTDTDEHHQGVSGYVYASDACYACHPDGTSSGAFNHNTSIFPLTGAHTTLNCQQCHQSGYPGTPTECVACHQSNYNTAANPSHTVLAISTDCVSCHSTNPNWEPALFPQHNQYFELIGRHAEISQNCTACHNGNYNSTPDQCQGCHINAYNNAQNPNHIAAGIPVTCESCHNSFAWIPSTFNHTSTGFELVGQHASIACSSCHEGVITGLSPECISCHQENYNTAPNHVAQNYPTTCQMCHNSVAWNQVVFNHNNTNFPLTGAHISTPCSECHTTGYTGTTTVCSECHQAAYNGSINPSHTALAIPTTCQTCHTTNPNWEPATFPIHNNYYALVGAHAAIATQCFTCHQGNYNNTPNTCDGCHHDDYIAATNPNHQAAGFPLACETCHTQNAWSPSTFDHDGLYFPIYSGNHQGRWNTCYDCHPNPGNFGIFTCTTACHPQSQMNSEHQGVSGYVYQSSACLSCHPDGGNQFKIKIT